MEIFHFWENISSLRQILKAMFSSRQVSVCTFSNLVSILCLHNRGLKYCWPYISSEDVYCLPIGKVRYLCKIILIWVKLLWSWLLAPLTPKDIPVFLRHPKLFGIKAHQHPINVLLFVEFPETKKINKFMSNCYLLLQTSNSFWFRAFTVSVFQNF